VWANARNTGSDAIALLKQMPLDRLAYVTSPAVKNARHVPRLPRRDVSPQVLELLSQLCIMQIEGVMLERDDQFLLKRS